MSSSEADYSVYVVSDEDDADHKVFVVNQQEVTGSPAAGKAPVAQAGGTVAWTDVATQEELNAHKTDAATHANLPYAPGYTAPAPSGSDDLAALQTAAAAAVAAKVPLILKGAYLVATPWTPPTNCDVRGADDTHSSVSATGTTGAWAGLATMLLSNDGVRLRGVTVNAKSGASSAKAVQITGSDNKVTFCAIVGPGTGTSGWGIFLGTTGARNEVAFNSISNAGHNCVEINDSSYNNVHNNIIDVTNGDQGIEEWGDSATPVVGNRIEGNWIANGAGIGIVGTRGAVVHGNRIQNVTSNHGIQVINGSTGVNSPAVGTIVSENVVNGTTNGNCITVDSGYGIHVLGNTAIGAGGDNSGIKVAAAGTEVIGNTCYANGRDGIESVGADCTFAGNACIDNSANSAGTRDGIRLGSGALRNTVTGNRCYDTRRQVTDAVTNGTATVTSATAAFTSADLRRLVTGTDIPANTYVGVVNSATSIGLSSSQTANVPVVATGSGSGKTLNVGGARTQAYGLQIDSGANDNYSAGNNLLNNISGEYQDGNGGTGNARHTAAIAHVANGSKYFHAALDFDGSTFNGSTRPAWLLTDGTVKGYMQITGNVCYFGALSNHPVQFQTNGANVMVLNADGSLTLQRSAVQLQFGHANQAQTTVGSAGAASAPPASPTKYFKVMDATGTVYVIPAYAAS